MSIRTMLAIVCTIAVFICANNSVEAQRATNRLNQKFRHMGHFQSSGYHWRTPGPCVGYYNPYSHHNSALRTGGFSQGAGNYMAQFGGHFTGGPGYEGEFPTNFDQPSGLNYNSITAPPAPTENSNEVDSDIDDSEIDAEAQSILGDEDGQIGEELEQSEESENEVTDDDEASLWREFPEFGYMQSGKQPHEIRYPVRRVPSASRNSTSRTH